MDRPSLFLSFDFEISQFLSSLLKGLSLFWKAEANLCRSQRRTAVKAAARNSRHPKFLYEMESKSHIIRNTKMSYVCHDVISPVGAVNTKSYIL